MRILRRRSNLEVSAKGFALFVLGLVVSTFVGGALRTILSSERVHQRIVRELKNRFPKNEIDVQSIEVLLSRGIWPALGLRVHDLVVRQDLCGKLSFDLRVPETIMPMSFWSLRRGQVRLGRIEIPGGRLDLDFRGCAKVGETDLPPAPTLRETVRERGIRPPRLEWESISRTLDGIDLSKMEVTFKKAPQWKLRITQARVRFGKELDVTASLDLQRSLPFGALSHLVGVQAVSNGGDIDWLLTSELKEGRLRWTGKWSLAENVASAKAVVTQIPLKELATELHQTGFLAREYKFKSAWLTCIAEWTGALSRPFATPVALSACHVEGGYGTAALAHAEVYGDRSPPLATPAHIEFQHANVAALAEAFGAKLWPAVIARAGLWTGTASISGPREWNAGGRLQGLEIFFSNQSIRGKQVVESVAVDVRRQDDTITGALEDFELQGGTSEGRVSGAYAVDKKSGRFEIDFARLGFHPSVQSVMLGAQAEPFKFTGAGGLADGGLASWSGHLSSARVAGEGWRADGFEATTSLAPSRAFLINAHAAAVHVDPSWRYFARGQVAMPGSPESYDWKDVSARLMVRSDGGQVSNLRATGPNAVHWLVDGTWLREGEANAQMKVSAAGKVHSYHLRGDREDFAIEDER